MFIFQIAALFAFNTGQRDGLRVCRFALTFLRRVCILIIIGIPANRYRCRLIHRGGNCAVQQPVLLSKTVYPFPFCATGAEITRLLLRRTFLSNPDLAFLMFSIYLEKKKLARKFYTWFRDSCRTSGDLCFASFLYARSFYIAIREFIATKNRMRVIYMKILLNPYWFCFNSFLNRGLALHLKINFYYTKLQWISCDIILYVNIFDKLNDVNDINIFM